MADQHSSLGVAECHVEHVGGMALVRNSWEPRRAAGSTGFITSTGASLFDCFAPRPVLTPICPARANVRGSPACQCVQVRHARAEATIGRPRGERQPDS
jgi:hypothetical protein